jgi:2-(1,2-epoxy-1,2-dihydrophenyl)acetyl-CoA isomerase
MIRGLSAVVGQAGSGDASRSVILTGAGRAFCSGEDLEIAATTTSSEFAEFIDALQELTRQLLSTQVPTIAAINGPAVGGGCELALACDLRIASETATFRLPEVTLGLSVTGGTLELLKQTVGRGRAMELLLTGRTLDAGEAMEFGLVNEVTSEDRLMTRAIQVAERLTELPFEAVASLKRAVSALEQPALARAMEAETEAVSRLFALPAMREQIADFFSDSDRRST